MKTTFLSALLIVSFTLLILPGCATVIKGYEDRVDIINPPDDLKIYSKDGIELPLIDRIEKASTKNKYKFIEDTLKSIQLRSNEVHVLTLKSNGKEKIVELYPKIGAGWLMVDFITGIFPVFIDIYTGNWNHFDVIDAGF